MNKEDIIKLAKESGFYIENNEIYSMSTQSDQELTEWIERFASLVVQQEREKCARVCEKTSSDMNPMAHWAANECARLIRGMETQ